VIIPTDIVDRMRRRKPYWRPPTIHIVGEEGTFGTLVIDLHDNRPVIEWEIWIKDREEILSVVRHALSNYNEILEEMRNG
jgi:hypothetical protein